MTLDKLLKFRFFLAGAGVFLLVAVLVGYMVYASIARFASEKDEAAQAFSERSLLYARDPFPSEDNIRIEQDNKFILMDKFTGLMDMLSLGQIEAKMAEPTVFMRNLESGRRRMKQQFDDAGVVLPANFQYGFEKYVEGALPKEADVPKLTYQLHVVETLCRMLADARIFELLELTREVFETDSGPVARARPGRADSNASQQEQGGSEASSFSVELFSSMVFKCRFRAKESSLVTIFNNMASNQLFMCISNFRVEPGPTFRNPITERYEKPLETTGEMPTREKRLIFGKEDLNVGMDVVVYRFAAKARKSEETKQSQARSSRESAVPAQDSSITSPAITNMVEQPATGGLPPPEKPSTPEPAVDKPADVNQPQSQDTGYATQVSSVEPSQTNAQGTNHQPSLSKESSVQIIQPDGM